MQTHIVQEGTKRAAVGKTNTVYLICKKCKAFEKENRVKWLVREPRR